MIDERIDGPGKLDQAKEAFRQLLKRSRQPLGPSLALSKGVSDQVRLLIAWLVGLRKRPCMQS